jgi:ubiquinone/menaquinone biosynthesis C-methylase UbiE
MSDYSLVLSDEEVTRYRWMAAQARADEADAWQAAGIVPGAHVADVGCGPGVTLLEMADVVGPTGSVVGVDADSEAVDTARALIARSGVDNATVGTGAADSTGLAAGSFDVVVMRHVLAHNGGREEAIVSHLAELVRPGGCVYLVDVDMTAMRMRGAGNDAMELAGRYIEFHLSLGNDPQIGLRLGELLSAAGLTVLDHRGWYTVMSAPPGLRPPAWAARDAMVAEGMATPEDVARWQRALEELDAQEKRPVLFAPFFAAAGRRPD